MFFGGDPFEHFAGMHGGGGSRRGGMGGPPRDVDTSKLYETLGVSLLAVELLPLLCLRLLQTVLVDEVNRMLSQAATCCLPLMVALPPAKQASYQFRNDLPFECMPPQSD